jgi:hypothetical protein
MSRREVKKSMSRREVKRQYESRREPTHQRSHSAVLLSLKNKL